MITKKFGLTACRPRVRLRMMAAGLALCSLASACRPSDSPPLFVILDVDRTGIDFENRVDGDSLFNILSYPYFYDGGGVAAGDVNGDGLPDLFFIASEGPNRLYQNQGDLRFEDVTEAAGVAGSSDWSKGVTMADVDGDGLLDIYVSNVDILSRRGKNELFINNGDGSFTDRAAEYGLDFSGYSTHSSFFDFDGDGDLDVYLVNHSVHTEATHGPDTLRYERHPTAGDRLMRNDDGFFVDVSPEAGIFGGRIGYGLAAAVSDLDADGCPDIYVSNDFHEHDYLYFNRCDGTFEESIRQSTGHTSRSSMGNDTGDFDNDGLIDVIVADMLPARQDILNSSANFERHDLYDHKLNLGYHHQEIRNTLQWNRGNRRFSEIAYLAGVYATDWSWATLLADFDNDGLLDLLITNGIVRRPNDRDFSGLMASPPMMARLGVSTGPRDPEIIAGMPSVPIPNHVFRNKGDLTFEDVSVAWGLDRPSFSTGAVYSDLDNDGDLDLAVNDVNAAAWIAQNTAADLLENHSVRVRLRGTAPNTYGIGARVELRVDSRRLTREMVTSRGWQSAVAPELHFGLGSASRIDTLVVVWPDRHRTTLVDQPVDTLIIVDRRDGVAPRPEEPDRRRLFVDRTDEVIAPFSHRENTYFDFSREGLMPRRVSLEGPALATGDVNGDGRDDVFAGGAKGQAAALLLQQPDGSFVPSADSVWNADARFEDVDAAFFDADGDGDLDLYVVSAGNEFSGQHPNLADRLYINNGPDGLASSPDRLPEIRSNGCCVAPADFDADGDIDLFVGGRVVARHYGSQPRSYLLENDGAGFFSDVTTVRGKDLASAGMITGATWADFDGDGHLDLAVVGEWMPITIFRQMDGQLRIREDGSGLAEASGLWTSVAAQDLDEDGDVDLVAGNVGLNTLLQATSARPLRMRIQDVDADGRAEHLVTTTRLGEEYLLASPDELLIQVPSLAAAYRRYQDFGRIRLEDVLGHARSPTSVDLDARVLTTSIAENNGDGTFTLTEAPSEAQLAPVHAIATADVDGDGRVEILLAGNSDRPRRIEGRLDASYGTVLRRVSGFEFEALQPNDTGLYLDGQINGLESIVTAGGERMLVAARNNDTLQFVQVVAYRTDQRSAESP